MHLASTLFLLPLAAANSHGNPLRRHHARAPQFVNPHVAAWSNANAPIPAAATNAPLSSEVVAISSASTAPAVSSAAAVTSAASSAGRSQSQSQISVVGSALVASTATGLSDKFPSPTQAAASSTANVTSSASHAAFTQPAGNLPSTLSVAPSSASTIDSASSSASLALLNQPVPSSAVTRTTVNMVTTVSKTLGPSSSVSAADSTAGSRTAGMNPTTMIIVIVVSVVAALVVIGWCGFRKWKLRPSRRFDEKLKPINFSPYGDVGLEKNHMRQTRFSTSSAALQRRDLDDELDNPHCVAGVPEHDFTAGAGMAGAGAGGMRSAYGGAAAPEYDMYNHDPYAHAEAFEYDPTGNYTQQDYGHNVHAQQHGYQDQEKYGYDGYGGLAPSIKGEYEGRYRDEPTQDTAVSEGYADLHRGNIVGSANGSGQGHGHAQAQPQRYSGGNAIQYPVETFAMPMPDQYIGRPTGGAQDGPYAQAAQYRY